MKSQRKTYSELAGETLAYLTIANGAKLKPYIVIVEIEGTTDLLMHRYNPERVGCCDI